MTETVTRPLPQIDDGNREFWAGAARGELCMQRCLACGHIRYPISHLCPQCLSEDFSWQTLSGRASILSYVVFHQVYNRAFATEVPYNVVLVQLDEGPRMFSNVIDVPADRVPKVGDRVIAAFTTGLTDDVVLPQFRLAD